MGLKILDSLIALNDGILKLALRIVDYSHTIWILYDEGIHHTILNLYS